MLMYTHGTHLVSISETLSRKILIVTKVSLDVMFLTGQILCKTGLIVLISLWNKL